MVAQEVISAILVAVLAFGSIVCSCDVLAAGEETGRSHHEPATHAGHMSGHADADAGCPEHDCDGPCGAQASLIAPKDVLANTQSDLTAPEGPVYAVTAQWGMPPPPDFRPLMLFAVFSNQTYSSDTPVRRFDVLRD